MLLLLGGVCVRCGFDDPRALQIDHVNGNGCKTPFNNYNLAAKMIRALPGSYQLLCANCNWIKRAERNEHRKADGFGVASTELQKQRSLQESVEVVPLGVCPQCRFPIANADVKHHLQSLYHLHGPEIRALLSKPNITQSEISRWFGVERERIRQIAAVVREMENQQKEKF